MDGQVRTWLRLEGVAVLIAGAFAYDRLGGDWLWFLPALLAPDLSALGYLVDRRVGATVYNLFHNWGTGLAVLGAGVALDVAPIALAGAALLAHTGMDRAAGHGLKLMSGFHDTHLGRNGGKSEPSGVNAGPAATPTAVAAR